MTRRISVCLFAAFMGAGGFPASVRRAASFSVLLVSFVLAGCSSPTNSAPTVAFRKVPAAIQEGPYKTDISERDYRTDMPS